MIRFVDLRSHFGRHVSHADEVITDVNRRRVMARAHEDSFTIAWDYPGRTLLEVRILRSSEGLAGSVDDGPEQGQELVYQDVTGSFRDTPLRPDQQYFYTVFARHPGGEWVRWEEYTLRSEPASGRNDRDRLLGKAHGVVTSAGPLVLCLAVLLASLVLLPAAARASGDGGTKAEGKAPAVDAAAAAAADAAQTDPTVAAVLDSTGATVDTATPWGGTAGEPAGYRLEYRWAAAQATAVDEEWPLLRADAATPRSPYDSVVYRIRAADVTGLQVDVLLDGSRVIQVMPVDGETEFVLQEQTWAPFSWFPVVHGAAVGARPRLPPALPLAHRSRVAALSRLEPPLAVDDRHDRQFIGRVAVLLFLLAGFAWQFYEGWYAATGPSVGTSSSAAGSLASLPLLLIPPGLFVAGLILELSSAPRRGSWGLLAVLSGAASAYFLAAAATGATTNLNLTYYILLAVLALISVPRAFSTGKMGWSRNQPRYS